MAVSKPCGGAAVAVKAVARVVRPPVKLPVVAEPARAVVCGLSISAVPGAFV